MMHIFRERLNFFSPLYPLSTPLSLSPSAWGNKKKLRKAEKSGEMHQSVGSSGQTAETQIYCSPEAIVHQTSQLRRSILYSFCGSWKFKDELTIHICFYSKFLTRSDNILCSESFSKIDHSVYTVGNTNL